MRNKLLEKRGTRSCEEDVVNIEEHNYHGIRGMINKYGVVSSTRNEAKL